MRVSLLKKLGVLIILLWLVIVPTAVANAASKAIILNYHHLDPTPTTSSTISPGLFAQHMKYLKEHGYHVISMEQLKKYLLSPVQSEAALPERAVVITFDDGYASFYQYAFPILKEQGFSSTMFTIAGRVGNTLKEVPKLSWEQIRELSATGMVDFQTHTWNLHYTIDRKSALMVAEPQNIKKDLRYAADVLAYQTGKAVDAVAYPYGHVNSTLSRIAVEEGYRFGFTLNHGVVHKGSNLMQLPRIAVGDEGTTVKEFEKILLKYFPQ